MSSLPKATGHVLTAIPGGQRGVALRLEGGPIVVPVADLGASGDDLRAAGVAAGHMYALHTPAASAAGNTPNPIGGRR